MAEQQEEKATPKFEELPSYVEFISDAVKHFEKGRILRSTESGTYYRLGQETFEMFNFALEDWEPTGNFDFYGQFTGFCVYRDTTVPKLEELELSWRNAVSKAQRTERAKEWLLASGFNPQSSNGFEHIHFKYGKVRVDLWPTTELLKVTVKARDEDGGIYSKTYPYNGIEAVIENLKQILQGDRA